MDCKYYQDLLIQLPYNELSKEETTLLKNHLEVCDECREELEMNQNLSRFSKKLSTSVPVDETKEASINSILSEIYSSRKIRMLRINNYSMFRTITNAAAVFLIGLFLIQQIEIKRNLASLQSKIEVQDQGTKSQNRIPNNREFTSLSDNQLELLVNEYDKLIKENSAILTYLKMNYPEIYQEIQQRKSIEKKTTNNL
jgi:hypothetical protein